MRAPSRPGALPPIGGVAIRDATPDDLDAIMALEHATFPDDAWPEATMRAELRQAAGRYLVALAPDGALAGYAGLRVAGDQGDIQTIAVAPAHRRRGIARAMLLRLLEEARRRRASDVFLEVRADNPGAQALYESLGFEALAVRRGYYPRGVDAIVYRKGLR